MIAITNETLGRLPASILVPEYDREAVRPGIAHIGVGNFHRTHQAMYIDRCLHRPGQSDWAIVGIGLGDSAAARAKAQAFRRQDCLYSVTEYAPDGASQTRVVGAMIGYLHAPSEPHAVAQLLSSAEIRIVTLTITEGGYNFDEATGQFMLESPDVSHDLNGGPPRTAFGLIVNALERRKDEGIAPFTVVSCDNLRHNGDTTRRAVLAYANAYDPDLARWIDANVAFPNSMVDRIAPRVSSEEASSLESRTSVRDLIPAVSETFMQWVIEDKFPHGRPEFDEVGVELRDDVALFETVKGRLLNASHMLLAYPAILCGYRLVDEAMRDPAIACLLDSFMEQDAIPILEGPEGVSLIAYKEALLARFTNPALGDQLLRIAQDGAAKIPVFHSRTLSTLIERGGDIRREAFLLACFARYFAGCDDNGTTFPVDEPSMSHEDLTLLKDADGLGMLRTRSFRSLSLHENAEFVAAYVSIAADIEHIGVSEALEKLNSRRTAKAC